MRHGSLFSGIGGFDLAAEWAGWDNIFHCEWNEFGKKVLNHYWPKSISYNDITKTDFSVHRGSIDVLTGGFPCQPYSTAGKRLGKEDERHLWPHMLRAIQEIKPRWVVGENVLGLVSWNGGLVFQEVCTDLESQGYEVQPFVLPAAGVGAPHKRDRIFFVAFNSSNPNSNGLEGGASSDINRPASGKKESVPEHVSIYRQGLQFQDFPSVSPLLDGDDGISEGLDGITFSKWRKQSLMAGGNAIVPQVVYRIFNAINEYESTSDKVVS